jgi:hypothetical protein
MAVKTGPIDGADIVERLDAVRLSNDWSFRQLSAEMERVGITLSAQTLHQLLTDREAKPYDRTLHKVRRYLDERKSAKRSTRKLKGRAA